MNFTVVSTFSGCGGSSLGYKLAGGRILLVCEWDDNAVEVYKLNHPDTNVYHGDINDLSVSNVLETIGLQPGELDILDGSPPCQGFSISGKRDFTDNRNQLFKEYVRLLQGLQPKAFVMENVSGMVKGKMKIIFVQCLKELKACGYEVSARILNTKYYNVPQSRPRLIFIGIRKDLEIKPSHPKPQTKPILLKEALKDLKELGDCKPLSTVDEEHYFETKLGQAHYEHFGFYRCSWYRIPPTVLKTIASGHFHPDEPRRLSVNETKRVFSYPDDYQFIGTYKQVIARMGNSVPPNFMKAIAEHIVGLLQGK